MEFRPGTRCDIVLKYFKFCGMAHVRKIVREKNPDG